MSSLWDAITPYNAQPYGGETRVEQFVHDFTPLAGIALPIAVLAIAWWQRERLALPFKWAAMRWRSRRRLWRLAISVELQREPVPPTLPRNGEGSA